MNRQKRRDKNQKIFIFIKNKLFFVSLKFVLIFFIIIKSQNILSESSSEINLVIEKTGNIYFINKNFAYLPSKVLKNGQENKMCQTTHCSRLKDNENVHITLIFEYALDSCENMFINLSKIYSVDLSNFDASKVTSMSNMFSGCDQLNRIDFGNINTSSLENIDNIFSGCESLTSVDLSNLNFSKITSLNSIFKGCSSLIYLNLYSMKLNIPFDKNNSFEGINENAKYCIKDTDTKNYLLGNDTFSVCSDTCYDIMNTKIDIYDNKCVSSCPSDSYEYFNICYCANETYLLFKNEFIYEEKAGVCLNETPIGYYLDINQRIYKKCFNNCKFCYDLGNETINNCIECIPGFEFYIDKFNFSNCFQKCDNFYYFNESNGFNCIETCPKEFNKIIIDKSQCIDICQNDYVYKYEFNNSCFMKCPSGTYIIEDNYYYKCFDSAPDNYYLDSEKKIFKKCYENCNKCNIGGNVENNNCLECINNFYFYTNPMNITNCYEYCEHLYFFDSKNEFHCEETCQNGYKLIKNKKKCIDECRNDDTYKFEYNNECFFKCPNGTISKGSINICEDIYDFTDIKFYNTNINENITEKTNEYKDDSINNMINKFINETLNNKDFSNTEIKEKVLEKFQEMFISGFDTTNIDKGKDLFFGFKNINYTITTTLNQKNNEYNDQTTIDLGECEDKLKIENHIPPNDTLYLLKVDAFIDNVFKVEYEVYYQYSPNNFTKLDLSVCSNIKIDISIPINISPDEIDKYNMSSGLYNDICYSFTSESGTDKTLKDRQNDYKNKNISVCEEGCEFTEYDENSKKAKCSCFTKINLPVISEIKVDKKKLFSNFKNINNIANFKMLKCIYLIFDLKNIFKNTANYMMLFLFSLSKIALFIFMCHNNTKIKEYI